LSDPKTRCLAFRTPKPLYFSDLIVVAFSFLRGRRNENHDFNDKNAQEILRDPASLRVQADTICTFMQAVKEILTRPCRMHRLRPKAVSSKVIRL